MADRLRFIASGLGASCYNCGRPRSVHVPAKAGAPYCPKGKQAHPWKGRR